MKFVLAPDKYKGSLTSMEFCKAAEKGIRNVLPDADFTRLPLADGGDGTIEVVDHYLNGKMITLKVSNPFFQPIKASYLYSELTKTAFIEMAEASGHKLLNKSELDCKNATTFGTGELIIDAMEKGAKTILLGIGGSATNDCGIGMATVLGFRFLDEHGIDVKPVGNNLSKIKSIDDSGIHPKLKQVDFKVACDVSNPLYGKNGAAKVYAEQKGAAPQDIELLDKGLQDFSKVLDAHFKIDSQNIKGAGAAGGMGIGALTFLNTKLTPGIELVKEIADFDEKIKGADWIITGEGKLDTQTLSGKTIQGVIVSAKAQNIKVAAFCGAIDLDENSITDFGIQYSDAIINHSENLEDAMQNVSVYLARIAIKFAKNLV